MSDQFRWLLSAAEGYAGIRCGVPPWPPNSGCWLAPMRAWQPWIRGVSPANARILPGVRLFPLGGPLKYLWATSWTGLGPVGAVLGRGTPIRWTAVAAPHEPRSL